MSDSITVDPEFQALIPPLSAEEVEQLEANLLAEGCRDPLVTWKETGILLDGHNRYGICRTHNLPFKIAEVSIASRDDAKVWIIRNQFGRRNLPTYERGRLALTLEAIFQEKAKANQSKYNNPLPQNSEEAVKPIETGKEIAKIAGLSHDTIARIKAIESSGYEGLKEAARKQEISVNEAYQTLKRAQNEVRREERREERIAKVVDPLNTVGRFPLIYADPPWQYDFSVDDADQIENHYPTMTLEEICNLPVAEVATEDAVLILWATSPKLEEAFAVLSAWGFVYRTCAIWDKEWIGPGYYFRQRHELLLIATRGSLPVPLPTNRPDSIFAERRTKHSKKPELAYQLIERMYPELPKLELFARSARQGWRAWGNEAVKEAYA